MTPKRTEFVHAAEQSNLKAGLRGIETIESACRRLRFVLSAGAYRAPQRFQFIRELQDGLALLISAEGRQTLVEDFRANLAAIDAAAMELTRYTEGNTSGDYRYTEDSKGDYYTDEEDSDDPPACVSIPLAQPVQRHYPGTGVLTPEQKAIHDFMTGLFK